MTDTDVSYIKVSYADCMASSSSSSGVPTVLLSIQFSSVGPDSA